VLVLELCESDSGGRWVFQGLVPPEPKKPIRTQLAVTTVRVLAESGETLVFSIYNPPHELGGGFRAKLVGQLPGALINRAVNFEPTAGHRRLEARLPVPEEIAVTSSSLEPDGKQRGYQLDVAPPIEVRQSSWPLLWDLILWGIMGLAATQILGSLGVFYLLKRHRPQAPTRFQTATGEEPQAGHTNPRPPSNGRNPHDSTAAGAVATQDTVTNPAPPTVREALQQPSLLAAEAKLLRLVNSWWADDPSRSRAGLLEVARQHGFADLDLYESTNLEANLSQLTRRRFSFKPSRKALEWIFIRNGEEVLALPLDERAFEAGQALRLVARLFDGVDSGATSFRFDRADQACRLLGEEGGEYRLKTQGRLQVAGATLKSISGPAEVARAVPQTAVGQPEHLPDVISLVEAMLNRKGFDQRFAELKALLTNIQGQLVALNTVEQMLSRFEKSVEHNLETLLLRAEAGPAHLEGPIRLARAAAAEEKTPTLDAFQVETLCPPSAEKIEATTQTAGQERAVEPARPGPAPGSFERELDEVLPPLPLFLSPAVAQPGPPDYLKALGRANQILLEALGGWSVETVHLAIPRESGRDRIELHIPRDIQSGAVICACGPLVEDLLFQLAIGLKKPNGPFCALYVPSGCRMDRYSPGYGILLGGRLPDAAGWRPAQTRKCAILQRCNDLSPELYEVVRPMEVVFE
jgi:hypothetical protein